MRFTNQLQSLSNVTAGATATLQLPLGVSYELVKFKLTNITPAQMHNLRLKINGIEVQNYKSGAELQELNGFKGYAADSAGFLSWFFVQPELNMIPDQQITKLGTKDVKTLVIEFDVDSGVTSPVVKASALISNNAPLAIIKKVRRFTSSSAVAGLQEIDNIPTNGARISAVHFKKADVNKIEVKANNQTVYEAEQVEAREYQKAYDRTPNNSYFHVDWTLLGDSSEALGTAGFQDFRFKLDHAAAGGFDFIVEYLDTLNGGV